MHRNLRRYFVLTILVILSLPVSAQWQDNVFGNAWIDYTRDYLRIEVAQSGIQRIRINDLPASFRSKAPGTFQLWRRGKEVAILSATAEEIWFYGEVNDGASDSLLYRPAAGRLNPYVNLFSDKGYYFLTTDPNPKRAATVDGTQNLTGEPEPYHMQKDIRTYQDVFSFATRSPGGLLNNSFYEEANAWGSKRLAGLSSYSAISVDTVFREEIQLKNWVKTEDVKPEMELLFTGLNVSRHNIFTFLGPETGKNRIISNVSFSGYGGRKTRTTLQNSDFNETGKGFLKFISNTTENLDWYSVSYFTVTYPQAIDMQGEKSRWFNFPDAGRSKRRIKIANASEQALLLDISDPYHPKRILGKTLSDGVEFAVDQPNGALKVLAVEPAGIVTIAASAIHEVNLQPAYATNTSSAGALDGKNYDYFIIAPASLMEGAREYARYRESEEGGSHKVLLVDIRMVHDVYNYGEPSPVSIRSFMKSMLKDYQGERKNLFLLGYSVTSPARVMKELDNEVPTFGDPGSDNLLVAGLAGHHPDVQAIPVGRLKALNNNEIYSYLAKVKAYEHERTNIAWRKNVLHISGGQNSSEIVTLRDILRGLEPIIQESDYSGKINVITKSISSSTVEKVNISNEINEGIGLVTFFGHGSQTVTDVDIGYASDVTRGYANRNKYPLMYFNGCRVGNIFTGYQVHILSDDWLVTENKGAVVILANSYDSYVSTSARHIRLLYEVLFEQNGELTVGEVLKKVGERLVASNPNSYDIANHHQVCLQGDPALIMVTSRDPDYMVDSENNDVFIRSKTAGQTLGQAGAGELGIVVSNGGIYRAEDNLEVRVTLRYGGESKQLDIPVPAMRHSDTLWVDIDNLQNLSSVEVEIDPQDKLSEFTKVNNLTDLPVDWSTIQNLTFYPSEPLRDMIPPRFKVLFDDLEIPNRSTIAPGTEISVVVGDDRVIDFNTATLEVYLRPCWDGNCDAVAIPVQADWVDNLDNREFVITYKGQPLPNGEYEILVTGSDRAGNTPTDGGYVIQFRVGDASEKVEVTVSPNPASRGFVKFEISTPQAGPVDISLFNLMGQSVGQTELDGNGLKRVWYWNTTDVPSGVYIYKVHVKGSQSDEVRTGKVLVID